MSIRGLSWRRVFYYGEVFGFLVAWALGVLFALESRDDRSRPAEVNQFAAATDSNFQGR